MMEKRNFYVLTGGPGAGKTTLINELKERRYTCVEETGRKIIQEQLSIGGDAVPWENAKEYSKLMLKQSIDDYILSEKSDKIYFFDRGIPDVLGYERLIKLPENEKLIKYSNEYRYNPKVFILPPWEEIYRNDNERKQDFQTAVDTYEMMKTVYSELNYDLIEVPCTDIISRADFMLHTVVG